MSMDLTGITNKNEYYTNHYFATVFEDNAGDTIKAWNAAARESEEVRTPWSQLRRYAAQFYAAHDRYVRSSLNMQSLYYIKDLADSYLASLGYSVASPLHVPIDDSLSVPVYLEMKKQNGAPVLWVVLMASSELDAGIMESYAFDASTIDETSYGTIGDGIIGTLAGENLATKILFGQQEPPRFLILIGMNQIALIDRNKWNEKRYLQFELEEIFSRLENSTLQAMSVLLHKDSLCPDDGKILLDELDEQSQRNASGVSQDLKYALRESIELLGNEVLYDMRTRQGRDLEAEPVDAGQLTIECLRYMYRMLFVLFIEARPELGYAPIKAQSYYSGYSLESLRDIVDNIRDDTTEVGNGYYLHETLAKLYDLIYNGYPKTEEELEKATGSDSLHDLFLVAPLKAHIFDPEYTKMITEAKLRNSCMLQIIELMSLTKSTGKKNSRRGRISYANLGINQMGAVYEALLSYRGFVAEHDLYEVKRAGDSFNELDVGYFVSEGELNQYTEDERVRYESGEKKGKLRMYEKGTFIYRLAGREREKSASYYTPEVLTKCLVKYALKELLEDKTADEILQLTICEPAMGSAAFLNEAINQLAEAYISRKEQETGQTIGYEDRFNELQKVKMYIADRNVYGIDLNPVAVELAEVSLWLNTIYEGGFVPWFGTQLINGNSLIGARRQCYQEASLTTTSKGLHWYENAPERVPLGTVRKKRRGNAQIYHFLLGDPGMCSYSDKVIKSLEAENIKAMKAWNKKFTAPYSLSDLETLRGLSEVIDELWANQIKLRQTVEQETQDSLSVFGHSDTVEDSHTTIRQKDLIYSKLYKSEHMKNAGPYARLKFAMDYWCALWFWPIDKADMLPSRSEFLNDLNLILVGTFSTKGRDNLLEYQQLSLFPSEQDVIVGKIKELFPDQNTVDIDNLCTLFPRLALVRKIAEQNHFMHWELEFADLFAERGGFDLMLGNPPWIKVTWNETATLADIQPQFAIKKYTAQEMKDQRDNVLVSRGKSSAYLFEYVASVGMLNYLNAYANYPDLQGQQTNLYRCFLPQAYSFDNNQGVFAYVHPDGIFDDPKAGRLRKIIYPKMKKHFQFVNELLLFTDISDTEIYSLNIYSNRNSGTFEMINNLFSPHTIDESYEDTEGLASIPEIKTDSGKWNIAGHKRRIVVIGRRELKSIASIYDDETKPDESRLPRIYADDLLETIKCFTSAERRISDEEVYMTQMYDETNAQDAQQIKRETHFPESNSDFVYSGPHIAIGNPLFKTPRKICKEKADFDRLDLTYIREDYLQRSNYRVVNRQDFKTGWGEEYTSLYRIASRKMLGLNQARTLMSAIIPPKTSHINGIFGMCFKDIRLLPLTCAELNSLPYDFLVRSLGKSNFRNDTASRLPMIIDESIRNELACRSLLLSCITSNYIDLWRECYSTEYKYLTWAKCDKRLKTDAFSKLTSDWSSDIAIRTDYARRQLLVEIDVLVAMAMGMSVKELNTIYRLQFPVMKKYEQDTWYDAKGRIVFTTDKSLSGVGYDRKTWESEVKNAQEGRVFTQIITDDTMPGGPVERTIEYVAPFDRCDREQDYEIAWKFFEEKYGKQGLGV